jgi:lysine-arginine-ornithine-binding protein
MRRFHAALLALAITVVGPAAGAADTVTVATEGAYPPFNQTEPDGSFSGFEIELGNEICARAQLDCQWVKQDFSGMIPALQARKFDFIFSAMSINPDRQKVGLFSIPYISDNFRFYGRKGTGVDIPEGLAGKTVGTFTGSSGEAFMQAKWGDLLETRGYENIDQVNADLEAGRIDYGFNSQLVVSTFLATPAGADYEFFGSTFSDPILGLGMGAMMRQDQTELKERLDDAIRAVYADDTFDRLSEKYFGQDVNVRADSLW